mmetsp:Transcript_7186/g.26422  ORF Transcript_7186/g.26422 Transcript_7186/m.26422 type:complete len:918 (+) Transcript_7186:181-2934(+)
MQAAARRVLEEAGGIAHGTDVLEADGNGRLLLLDARGELRRLHLLPHRRKASQQGTPSPSRASPFDKAAVDVFVEHLKPCPRLELESCEHLRASPGGNLIAVAGMRANAARSAVYVIPLGASAPPDLRASTRPQAKKGGLADVGDDVDSGLGRAAFKECTPYAVDPQLYALRSSLRVLRLEWHPLSETHLVVLTSDAFLRMYDVSKSCEEPEQEIRLQLPNGGGDKHSGLATAEVGVAPAVVDFCFGGGVLGSTTPPTRALRPQDDSTSSTAFSWERLAVFLLASDWSVYFLCPLIPVGCSLPARTIVALMRASQSGTGVSKDRHEDYATTFLRTVFVARKRTSFFSPPEQSDGLSSVAAIPASLDVPDSSTALSIARSTAEVLRWGPPAVQGPLPIDDVWASDSSQNSPMSNCSSLRPASIACTAAGESFSVLCIAGAEGTVRVFMLAESICPLWLAQMTPDLRKFNQRSDLIHSPPEQLLLPPLLLVDVIELDIPSGNDSTGVSHPEVKLLAGGMTAESVLCRHPGGVYCIVLTWLPILEQWLAKHSTETGDGLGTSLPLPRVETLLLAPCPMPIPTTTLAAPGGLVLSRQTREAPKKISGVDLDASSTFLRGLRVLEDPLTNRSYGIAVSVPMPGNGSSPDQRSDAELHVLPIASIGAHLHVSTSSALAAPSPSSLSLADRIAVSARDAEVHSLSSPLPALQKPFVSPAIVSPGQQSLSSTSVEGQEYFMKVCRHMRESYVEYAHHMHTEIMHRAEQLKGAEDKLDREWQRALDEVAALEKRKEELNRRFGEVESNASELLERVGSLTQKMQSEPAELSAAEKRFKSELALLQKGLPAVEERTQNLVERASAVVESQGDLLESGQQPSVTARKSFIPEEQKRKMQLILAEQTATIDSSLDTLRSLQHSLSQLHV